MDHLIKVQERWKETWLERWDWESEKGARKEDLLWELSKCRTLESSLAAEREVLQTGLGAERFLLSSCLREEVGIWGWKELEMLRLAVFLKGQGKPRACVGGLMAPSWR